MKFWHRITSYNVCYTKLLRGEQGIVPQQPAEPLVVAEGLGHLRIDQSEAMSLWHQMPDEAQPGGGGHRVGNSGVV